jgi:hypothetical protein
MPHTLLKKSDDVLIFHPIIDFLAIPPGLHQVLQTKPAQVMRDGRLADSDSLCQSAHMQLMLYQGKYYAHPAGIAEGAKQLCNLGSSRLIKQTIGGAHLADYHN